MSAVRGFSPYYFGPLPIGKEIGIFTAMIVWILKRETTTTTTTEGPGKVKKLDEFGESRVYFKLLKDNSVFHIVGN